MIEVIVAVLIAGILVRVAMMKLATPATLTLPGQVKSAAEQLRRAQTLASIRKQRMSVTATKGANGTLTIGCATSPPACPSDAGYVLRMDQGVVVGTPGGVDSYSVYFNSLGQPVDSSGVPNVGDVTLTVSFPPTTYSVTVAALTGRITVSP